MTPACTGAAQGVDNQALFDFYGKALASLPTFKYIHTGAVTDHVFTKIDPVEITATDSDSIDAIKAQLRVRWPHTIRMGWTRPKP